MSWQDEYKKKLVSLEEAATKLYSGDKVYMSGGMGAPVQLMEAVTARYKELTNLEIVSGQLMNMFTMFTSPEYIGHINYHTIFMGPYERAGTRSGNVEINSVSLSKTVATIRDYYGVNTLIADVSEPDENGDMFVGPLGVAGTVEVAEFATKIIVQVNKYQPKVKGYKDRINVKDVHYICEYDHELPALPPPEITPVDQKIAELLLPYIKDGSCIQLGLGGLANAVGFGLTSKKNLSAHTEMFNDSMMELYEKGSLSGNILAGHSFGTAKLYDFVEKHVKMAPMSIVNNPVEIAKNDNMVSINCCLMSDLTGQICSESIGAKQYSAIGGQLDFVRGAAMSKGGQSFLCMPSTATVKGEVQSTIVSCLPQGQIVTTPRDDVMYVVTEYGVANLWCKPLEVRVNELIKIAHPDFREQLHAEALAAGLICE
ncbi:MAG: acetyl-CoA hydrolase/transferase C-terminal domain-containing protein [Oscillospiraceae bacterium]